MFMFFLLTPDLLSFEIATSLLTQLLAMTKTSFLCIALSSFEPPDYREVFNMKNPLSFRAVGFSLIVHF